MLHHSRVVLPLASLIGALALAACSGSPVDAPLTTAPLSTSVTNSGAIVDSVDSTPQASPVSNFDLTITALGVVSTADTTDAVPLAGATVSLTRITTDRGDTVTVNADAGSATTDTDGRVRFSAVPTGFFYLVRAAPAAGSSYQAASFTFGSCGCQESPALSGEIWLPHR